jgi:hypothetical protein
LIFVGHRYSDLEEMQEVVEALLNVNPTFLAISVNYEISTPLDLACRLPIVNSAVIAKLIQANPTCAALLNNHTRTPLHVYVEFGEHHDLEGARCILDAHQVVPVLKIKMGGRRFTQRQLNEILKCYASC